MSYVWLIVIIVIFLILLLMFYRNNNKHEKPTVRTTAPVDSPSCNPSRSYDYYTSNESYRPSYRSNESYRPQCQTDTDNCQILREAGNILLGLVEILKDLPQPAKPNVYDNSFSLSNDSFNLSVGKGSQLQCLLSDDRTKMMVQAVPPSGGTEEQVAYFTQAKKDQVIQIMNKVYEQTHKLSGYKGTGMFTVTQGRLERINIVYTNPDGLPVRTMVTDNGASCVGYYYGSCDETAVAKGYCTCTEKGCTPNKISP